MASHYPKIGAWYEDRDLNTVFEVVAIDDHTGTIELQYKNGDIDELEPEEWISGAFVITPPPDDAQVAYDFEVDDDWDHELFANDYGLDHNDRYNFSNLPDLDT